MARLFSPPRAARTTLALVVLPVVLAALLAPTSRPAGPAPAPAATAYLFLSPNTDDDLPLAEAVRRLRGPEQDRSRRLAEDLLRAAGVARPRVHHALGDWSDGAENSLLAEAPAPADARALRYAAGWFGLLARQKSVLVFHPAADGPDGVTTFEAPGADLAALRRALDAHGVRHRTLVPTGRGHAVVVFHEGRRLGGPLERLARAYGAGARTTPGRGEFLGDDTRPRARRRFREEIRAYERLPGRPRYRPAARLALAP